MKRRVRNSLLLAVAAMWVSFPMFLYQFQHHSQAIFMVKPSQERLFYLSVTQSIIVFALAFLSALVGFLYSERLKLPRFGRPADIPAWLSIGLAVGIVFTPLSYFVIDRDILRLTPQIFPSHWGWALVNMLGGAVTQEVIARFGLLTICIYFLDRWRFRGYPWPAIAAISLFGSLGTYLFFLKFHILGTLLPSQILVTMSLVFMLQWLYCEVYLRTGFLAATCIHFGVSTKTLFYSFLPL